MAGRRRFASAAFAEADAGENVPGLAKSIRRAYNLPMTTRPNLVLVGFMGSGKSSIGRAAAHRLGFQFVDTDALVIERAGLEISEIFARHGEDHFRDLETRVIESLSPFTRYVIATGGGAVLREQNRQLLRELGYVVLLTASPEIIYERVGRSTKRPLLQTADPKAVIARLLAERAPAYDATAHLTIDTSALSRDQTVDQLCTAARNAFGWARVPEV